MNDEQISMYQVYIIIIMIWHMWEHVKDNWKLYLLSNMYNFFFFASDFISDYFSFSHWQLYW